MNLQRKKNEDQEYKAMLIDNLQRKDNRKTLLEHHK